MLETLLFWLFVGFVVAIVLGVVLYSCCAGCSWAAERMARIVDRSVGGAAAHALTRLQVRASESIALDDATNLFGAHIDRLAKIMDSAIKLPIIGRVGLDAVLDLIPVFGNFAGAAVSLTLIARTLQFRPPPASSENVVECAGRHHPRRHSPDWPARRHLVEGERQERRADA